MTKITNFYDKAFEAMHNLVQPEFDLQEIYNYVWSLKDEAEQLLKGLQDDIDREAMENESK